MAALPTLDEIAAMSGRDLDDALLAAELARREVEAAIAAITAGVTRRCTTATTGTGP